LKASPSPDTPVLSANAAAPPCASSGTRTDTVEPAAAIAPDSSKSAPESAVIPIIADVVLNAWKATPKLRIEDAAVAAFLRISWKLFSPRLDVRDSARSILLPAIR